MTTPFLTDAMLTKISRMPKAKRAAAMKLVGQEEWSRCADDIFYWLDPSAHLVPYVYTKDPHPMHVCIMCNDGEAYHFNKRQIHLLNRHKVNARTDNELKPYFKELPTIRPFPDQPYFKPIIESWLQEPLMVIEKSRDMMATWLGITMFYWDAFFHEGRQHIFQSETAMKTRELVERLQVIHDNQPKWFRDIHPVRVTEGIGKAGLAKCASLQSEIIGFPQGADKIRQYHPSGMFSDEAAFNPNASETFAALKPAIQNGGRYLAVSSANPSFFMHLAQDSVQEIV